jgi:UDP-N-acetyl-D-mannosaminuronate dehydrogenase
LASVALDEELGRCDVACVITAHDEIDYEDVVARAPLVVDFRGVTRDIAADHLIRLGARDGRAAVS